MFDRSTYTEDKDATELATALATCSHLEELSMTFIGDGDSLSSAGSESLRQSLVVLTSLISLEMRGVDLLRAINDKLDSMLMSLMHCGWNWTT